ncbi:MAG: hypothetical protein J0H91_06600 [Rhodospirillales bacterium]|nr:hypothetical protein [Rhodospirillales bacterium]
MSALSQSGSGTFAFARDNARVLVFGAMHTFFSAPGQTLCIGLFIASFSAAFGLTAGDIGGLYLLATLASVSIGTQKGPRIGVQKGPLLMIGMVRAAPRTGAAGGGGRSSAGGLL